MVEREHLPINGVTGTEPSSKHSAYQTHHKGCDGDRCHFLCSTKIWPDGPGGKSKDNKGRDVKYEYNETSRDEEEERMEEDQWINYSIEEKGRNERKIRRSSQE